MTSNMANPVEVEAVPPSRTQHLIIQGLKIVVLAFVVLVIADLVASIDFSQVWSAISKLSVAQVLLIVALVLVRQILTAAPLAFFVEGLGMMKAIVSDLSGNLVATLAPPPSDVVIRFAMFRSWGIGSEVALAGLSLNTVIYYVLRFASPTVGFLILLFASRYDGSYAVVALVSGVIATVIAGLIVAMVRAERLAAAIGRSCARVVRRVRPKGVDPDAWAEAMVGFRTNVKVALRRGWGLATVTIVAQLLTEGVILLVAIRAVGIPFSSLDGVEVLAAFCIAYPLTAMPLAGIGILDAALYGLIAAQSSSTISAQLVAAILIWRVATLALPLVLGAFTTLYWRRQNPTVELKRGAHEGPTPVDTGH